MVGSLTNGKRAPAKDGPLAQADFLGPTSVAADSSGNLFVADSGNCRIRHIRFRW